MAAEEEYYRRAAKRIEWRTLLVGGVAAAAAAKFIGARGAIAILCGTLLAWVNFELLSQVGGTLEALVRGQQGQETVRIPKGVYAKLLGLLALLLLAAYVMLAFLNLPALPLLGGLLAVVPAIVWELITELTQRGGAS